MYYVYVSIPTMNFNNHYGNCETEHLWLNSFDEKKKKTDDT